jgi:2,4-dienoyl-CoA reductase-like NADH-dependent reductase (Old Yellow Enzyme family)
MPNLFDTININKMELRNRFIRSATTDGLANQGMVSDVELSLYRELAKGEIGLIVSHGLSPTKEGQISPGQLSVHTDEAIPSLSKLVSVVHENSGKIAAQIMHCGWQCRQEVTGLPPVGPSALVNPHSGIQIRELSSDEIYELIESYVQAARRIIEAGFDAVQLHCAHGWFLSAFLSPVTNKRDDEWGGSVEKRSNFIRRIYRGIRQLVGPDYPILVKLGLQDYFPEGKTVSEGIETARLLEEDGVDAIEVSGGLEKEHLHHIRLDALSPYYVEECRQVRKELSIPVILVGGMRKLEDMQAVIDEKVADAISMCRPFIMDPYLVKNLREGLTDGSGCTSCNQCLGQGRLGYLRCTLV